MDGDAPATDLHGGVLDGFQQVTQKKASLLKRLQSWVYDATPPSAQSADTDTRNAPPLTPPTVRLRRSDAGIRSIGCF